MKILETFKSLAKNKNATIGIGLGELEDHNKKIYEGAVQFLKDFNSTVILFGNEKAIQHIKNSNSYNENIKRIEFSKSTTPEETIFNYLENNLINAIVRGNLSSIKFLANLKKIFSISEINRLTLLETFDGIQFFYGPVGIDECNSINDKISFVQKAIKQFTSLKIDPNVSILSGGRLGDRGRDSRVDESINIADEVVKSLSLEFSNILIRHDEILLYLRRDSEYFEVISVY